MLPVVAALAGAALLLGPVSTIAATPTASSATPGAWAQATPASTESITAQAPVLSFRALPFAALDVPEELRPFYRSNPAPMSTEATSPIMRVVDGVPYDMPLRQAEAGYAYLNSYRITGNAWYILKARAQADRLIAMRVTRDGGWFFPNTFPYSFAQPYGGSLVPPWYSGIAQGAATGFFARLWEMTGDAAYRDAAYHTMLSMLVPSSPGAPWVSNVDSNGYLRIQEYPASRWEYVFNGHMEAAMGLYDYYRATEDSRALELYRGALTSVIANGRLFRNTNWVSAYSLGARAPYTHYHRWVISQMLELHALSGDSRFVRLANEFDADYPASSSPGRVRVAPGSYTAYRYSANGTILASRTLVVRAWTTWPVSARGRVMNQPGQWFKLDGPTLGGFFIRESVGRVYQRGAVDTLAYRRPVPVRLSTGLWRMEKVGADGIVSAGGCARIVRPELAFVMRHAVVNGSTRYLLGSGRFAGYWIPEAAVAIR